MALHFTNCFTKLANPEGDNPPTESEETNIAKTDENVDVEVVELDETGDSLPKSELDSDVIEIIDNSQPEEANEDKKFTIPLSDSSN